MMTTNIDLELEVVIIKEPGYDKNKELVEEQYFVYHGDIRIQSS